MMNKEIIFAGPLIGNLFAKLDQMISNSLYENLLLTGIVARMAAYPQPLLRSFLLNTNMVFHPSVKSLYQVVFSFQSVHLTVTGQCRQGFSDLECCGSQQGSVLAQCY